MTTNIYYQTNCLLTIKFRNAFIGIYPKNINNSFININTHIFSLKYYLKYLEYEKTLGTQ